MPENLNISSDIFLFYPYLSIILGKNADKIRKTLLPNRGLFLLDLLLYLLPTKY